MIIPQLLLLLLFPLCWPLVAKRVFNRDYSWREMGISMAGVSLLIVLALAISQISKTTDTEIWNGYVTSKERVKKSCPVGWTSVVSSFCSNYITRTRKVGEVCTTNSNGVRSCTPIYITEYNYIYSWEQRWYVYSTLQTYEISRIDRQGADVPPRWDVVKTNDPVSAHRAFTNYVKASPLSLFNSKNEMVDYSDVPLYPTVFDYYKINRVITVGKVEVSPGYVKHLNESLSKELNTLGAAKQVNIIVILTNKPYDFKNAVEQKWVGGKKNDVVIFLGLNNRNVSWAEVMTFGLNIGNELFSATLRSKLMNDVDVHDVATLTKVIAETIKQHYDRPHMEQFEYLKWVFDIPTWLMVVLWLTSFGLPIILTFVFLRVDV